MPRITIQAAGETTSLDYETDAAVLPFWGAPAWRDEFDGTSVDSAKWNVWDRTTLGPLADTGEVKQQNSFIRDGKLVMRALWRDPVVTTPQGGSNTRGFTHTTGYVSHIRPNGSKVYEQQYGRWEIRAKFPTGPNSKGTCPAIWLRSSAVGGVSKPFEIDILEAYGQGGDMTPSYNTYTKDTAGTTFHSSTSQAAVDGKPYRKTYWRWFEQGIPRDIPTGFHTIAFEYMPTYIALIVDGVERKRVTPSSPDPVNKAGSAANPSGTLAWLWDPSFVGPFHLRLNLHMGPEATADKMPDPNNRQWTADPQDYEIEYVRIYPMPQ